MRSSAAPGADAIVGYEWAGYNTAPMTVLLGNRKFIKAFERGSGGVEGYNMLAAGTRLDEPWVRRVAERERSKLGFYAVRASGEHGGTYPNAAFIDYAARPEQPWFVRAIDDYLVQPDPSDPDVLLGKAYLTLGAVPIPAGYFVLQRLRAIGSE